VVAEAVAETVRQTPAVEVVEQEQEIIRPEELAVQAL
jgi:hypothetical protein